MTHTTLRLACSLLCALCIGASLPTEAAGISAQRRSRSEHARHGQHHVKTGRKSGGKKNAGYGARTASHGGRSVALALRSIPRGLVGPSIPLD
jgi:hypothetical protein